MSHVQHHDTEYVNVNKNGQTRRLLVVEVVDHVQVVVQVVDQVQVMSKLTTFNTFCEIFGLQSRKEPPSASTPVTMAGTCAPSHAPRQPSKHGNNLGSLAIRPSRGVVASGTTMKRWWEARMAVQTSLRILDIVYPEC